MAARSDIVWPKQSESLVAVLGSYLMSIISTSLRLALGAVALLTLPAATQFKVLSSVGTRNLAVQAIAAASFIAVGLWITRARPAARTLSLREYIAACCVAAVPTLLAVTVAQVGIPRLLLAVTLALSFMLIAILAYWPTRRDPSATAVVLLLAASGIAGQALIAGNARSAAREPSRSESVISGSMYDLAVTSYHRYLPQPESTQGGLGLLGERYVLVTGDGDLFALNEARDREHLEIDRLPYRVPLNRGAFEAAAGAAVNKGWFRVADVLTQETERGVRLLSTHHFWKVGEKCWVYRVSALEGTLAELTIEPARLEWSTVFESTPCMPLARPGEPVRFSGINSGGRMVLLSPDLLLVSVGDHELDGYSTSLQISQDGSASHGKLVLVDLRNGDSENYSIGHRNPQGLALSADGQIWSTEHGPQGGDELNAIHRNANYGWPLVSYGTEYGAHAWPVSETPGRHAGFERPYYSWVPSIGVSNLVEMSSPLFERWRGDLIIGSLRDQALWRIRVAEGRVVMTERIPFGERIRDLQVGHDGALVVWTDRDAIHFIRPSNGEASGEALYRICAGCHVPPDGEVTAVGPHLKGIVGRRVASVQGYEYSVAMRAVEGEWTRERLDAFLADPRTKVPGTSMQLIGMRDPESRQKLIDFLASPESRLDVAPEVPE